MPRKPKHPAATPLRPKRYYGEEAEVLTPAEVRRFETWLAAASDDDLLACEEAAPVRHVAAILHTPTGAGR